MVRKVNFLGMDVDVMDDDDIAAQAAAGEPARYMLARVEDMDDTLAPPEFIRRRRRTLCEVCGAVCWYDPKMLAQIAPLTLQFICVRCLVAEAETAKTEQAQEPS